MKIEFSTFSGVKMAQKGTRRIYTIDQIIYYCFRQHTVRENKDGPQFSLARFSGSSTEVHCRRDNITGAYGLVLDFDNKGQIEHIDKDVVHKILGGYRYILHTTHSHLLDEGRPKYRAILFFNKPVNNDDFSYIANHFMRLFPSWESNIDSNCDNITWRWYLPSCPSSTQENAEIVINDGALIDVDEVLKLRMATGEYKNRNGFDKSNSSLQGYPPAARAGAYTKDIHIVKEENQDSVNSVKHYKDVYKSYLAPARDEITLRERVINILFDPEFHPSKFSYEEWIRVGGAIKGAGLGVEVWDEWSSLDGDKYKGAQQDILPRWRGFDGRATEATVFHLAKQKGVRNWLGYKVTKQRGKDGKLHTAYVLNYHELDGPKPVSEEELAKLELVYEDETHFPEQLIDRAPDPIAMWVDYVFKTHIKPNKPMAFASSFVTFAGLYHHRVLGPNRCSPNIYVVGLDGSGKGKAHGIDCAIKLYDALGVLDTPGAVQNEVPTSGHGIGMSLLAAERSVTYLWPEFQIKFLEEMKGRHTPTFLKQVKNNLLDWYSQTNGPVNLFGANAEGADKPMCWYPHISIYGTAQPELFYKNYADEGASGGFLARMLPIIGGSERVRALGNPPLDMRIIPRDLLKFAHKIIEIPKGISKDDPKYFNPTIVEFDTPNLNDMFTDFSNSMIDKAYEQEKAGAFLTASIYQRVAHQALKVAIISHEGDTITRNVLEWAMDVAETSAENIIQNAIINHGTTVYESQMQRLYKDIKYLQRKNRGPVSKRDISRRSTWLDKSIRDKYLTEMCENEMLTMIPDKTPGRPATLFAVVRRN